MMTPEEIKQIVEDYRKSSNLNELRIRIGDKFDIDTRNFLRNERDKVKNKNNNKGAQGATNGTQGTANGAQGAQSNVNVKNTTNNGAQGTANGTQGTANGTQGTANGTQGTANGTQGTANGAQGTQNNVNVKNKYKEVDQATLDKGIKDIKTAGGTDAYIKNLKRNAKNDSLNIKDMMKYSSTNTSNIDFNTFNSKPPENKVKDTSASGKLNLVKVSKLKDDSPAANAGISLERRKNLALKNAAFNMSKNKNSEYSRADFRKDFPNSFSAKEFNKRQKRPKVTDYSSYDPYETVLGYVLSEGHADSVEEAHYIMMQMDAETIQTIIAEYENI